MPPAARYDVYDVYTERESNGVTAARVRRVVPRAAGYFSSFGAGRVYLLVYRDTTECVPVQVRRSTGVRRTSLDGTGSASAETKTAIQLVGFLSHPIPTTLLVFKNNKFILLPFTEQRIY